ncbi:MAG: hypothetical protein H6725_12590 [Sandaracinaceae bacterium]|nr:hypothetical protein [Sandaracinaceae bacterium]
MSTHAAPPVRQLVLFKHGVAYLEHAGPVTGNFELAFDKDAMNDVLKSFALWVPQGDATVGAVAFDSPEDPLAALRERGLDFDADNVLRGLLTFMRGRAVRLHGSAPGAPLAEGEVLGLQQGRTASHESARSAEGETLTLRTADGMLRVVPLADIRGVELLDEAARGELQVLMDKSRAATSRAHRSVRVDVSAPTQALHVAYTVPAPIWRVSYRLVAGREGTGSEARETVTVMAWAIVHNPVDRDLEDVQLVLTTGQPVSFVIDLYVPRHVTRAVVQEEVRTGAAPRSFAKAKGAPAAPPAPRPAHFGPPGAPAPQPARAMLMEDSPELEAFARADVGGYGAGAPEAAATGEQRGEFFEYRLNAPVSLTRGGSAMVPIATAKVDAARQRIWRWGDAPAPDIVLHFKNDTGVVLEEGAAVIYDENGYAGEAMVPFRARGGEVRVSFAKDLSVRCTGEQVHTLRFLGIHAQGLYVMESRERVIEHALHIENDHERDETLYVELPRQAHDTLELPPDATVEELASAYRVALPVPAAGVREASVSLRRKEYSHVSVSGVGTGEVARWINERTNGARVPAELERILGRLRAADDHAREAAVRSQNATALRQRQEAQTKQLAVLRDQGEEGQERLAVVREVRRLEADATELERGAAELNGRAHTERELARKELLALPGMALAQPVAPPG